MFPLRTITRRSWSLTEFLADERPDGRRRADKVRWNVHAILCPRSLFRAVKTNEEFSRPGVYILSSDYEEERPFPRIIYIGEGDPTRPRLEQHDRKKEFWTSLILFTAKDTDKDKLNKAHVQYLESRLVWLAKKVKRCVVTNGNDPQLPTLADAETAAMEVFLKEMLHICDLLDLTAFDVDSPPLLPLKDVSSTPQKLR